MLTALDLPFADDLMELLGAEGLPEPGAEQKDEDIKRLESQISSLQSQITTPTTFEDTAGPA
jgi:hypothetical protein